MAVLEAFVYDPLINWKLQLQPSPAALNDAIVDTDQQQPMVSVTDGIGMRFVVSANVQRIDLRRDMSRMKAS